MAVTPGTKRRRLRVSMPHLLASRMRMPRFLVPRRVRIGIAIGERTVRAVGVRGTYVLWGFECELENEESVASAIEKLLALAPLPRWPRAIVMAAIGPSRSQVRQLCDLPPIDDRRALAALVQEGASRFFLKNGSPLLTSALVPSLAAAPGEAMRLAAPWASAFDRDVIDGIAAACTGAHLRLAAALPSVVLLGRVLERETVSWRDGDTIAECRYEGGRLIQVRRSRAGSEHDTDPPRRSLAGVDPRRAATIVGEEPTDQKPADQEATDRQPTDRELTDQKPTDEVARVLSPLGEAAWRFADAYGAATSPETAPFAYRPKSGGSLDQPLPRWRRALAASVLACALVTAAGAPIARDAYVSHTASARLQALGPQRIEAARLEHELVQVSAALHMVAGFAAGRPSALAILRELADSLPDASALVTLRIDSASGTAVVLAAQVSDAVAAMDRLESITGVEIAGPVTREAIGGRELERATIRFAVPERTASAGRKPDAPDGARDE